MKQYHIAMCLTVDVDDGKHIVEPYYKVYEENEFGSCWFICDCDTMLEAKMFIEVSEQYPDLDMVEKIKMIDEKVKESK